MAENTKQDGSTTPALKSKTVWANTTLFAIYTIAKWINPELEIPENVLVAFTTVGNLLLRMVTRSAIGG